MIDDTMSVILDKLDKVLEKGKVIIPDVNINFLLKYTINYANIQTLT